MARDIADPAAAGADEQAPEAQFPSPAYAWTAVMTMTLISASSYIDRVIVGMLVDPIRADLNITDTQFSYLTGFAFALMYTTMGIPLGWAADRYSRRIMISVGCAFWSAMTAACGLASTYWQLFLCRVGVGVGEATLQPCAYPLIGTMFPKHKMGRALSIYGLGQPIGSALAMIIGGFVIGAFATVGSVNLPVFGEVRSWQLVFLTVGLPGILLALLAAIILRDPQRQQPRSVDQPGFVEVFRFMWRERKVYATLIISLGFVAVFAYGATAWFPAFLMRVHDFAPANAGLFIGLSTFIGGMIGSVAIGQLTDHFAIRGHKDITIRVLVPWAFGTFVCAALGPMIPLPWLSLLLFSGAGLFMLTATAIYHAVKFAVTPPEILGQVTAVFIFMTNLIGLTLGPTAIALCTDYVFKSDQAINYSIGLVGSVSMGVVVTTLWLGRRAVAGRYGNPAPLRPSP